MRLRVRILRFREAFVDPRARGGGSGRFGRDLLLGCRLLETLLDTWLLGARRRDTRLLGAWRRDTWLLGAWRRDTRLRRRRSRWRAGSLRRPLGRRSLLRRPRLGRALREALGWRLRRTLRARAWRSRPSRGRCLRWSGLRWSGLRGAALWRPGLRGRRCGGLPGRPAWWLRRRRGLRWSGLRRVVRRSGRRSLALRSGSLHRRRLRRVLRLALRGLALRGLELSGLLLLFGGLRCPLVRPGCLRRGTGGLLAWPGSR